MLRYFKPVAERLRPTDRMVGAYRLPDICTSHHPIWHWFRTWYNLWWKHLALVSLIISLPKLLIHETTDWVDQGSYRHIGSIRHFTRHQTNFTNRWFSRGDSSRNPRKAAVLVLSLSRIMPGIFFLLGGPLHSQNIVIKLHSQEVESETTDVTPQQTGLREAQEEINLNANHVKVLGSAERNSYNHELLCYSCCWRNSLAVRVSIGNQWSYAGSLQSPFMVIRSSKPFNSIPWITPALLPSACHLFQYIWWRLLWGVSAHIMLDLLEALELI